MLKRLVICVAMVVAMLTVPGPPARSAEGPGVSAPAAAADQGEQKVEKKKPMSGIVWILKSSGLIGFGILCLSIYFVSVVVRLFFHMTLDMYVPPDLVTHCQDLIRARDFQGAYDAARQDDSFLGRVLESGIGELPNGLMDARDAMERAGDAETVNMEKQISMLAVIGTLGPMIGLIGTLKGMISSFKVIALAGTTLDASQVAGGISEALILTFEGVFLSVPAIYFYAFFRNRVAMISSNAMLTANELLRHFHRAAKTKGPAARPTGGATPIPAAPPKPPAVAFEE